MDNPVPFAEQARAIVPAAGGSPSSPLTDDDAPVPHGAPSPPAASLPWCKGDVPPGQLRPMPDPADDPLLHRETPDIVFDPGAVATDDPNYRHAPANPPPIGTAECLDNSFTDTAFLRARVDGWTVPTRISFLATLADTGIVREACRACKMSSASAYALRSRDRRFADGWDAATLKARARLADDLYARAVDGCVDQIWKNGCIVGERHRYDNRLSMAVLRRLDDRCDRAARNADVAQRVADGWDEWLTATAAGDHAAAEAIAAPPPEPETDTTKEAIFMSKDVLDSLIATADPSTLRRKLVHLCAGLALDESADDELDEADEDQDEHDDNTLIGRDFGRVWEDDGSWRTDFPPPDNFDGISFGDYGDPDYNRAVTPDEADALAARFGRPGGHAAARKEADGETRELFFAMLSNPSFDPLAVEDEGAPSEPSILATLSGHC